MRSEGMANTPKIGFDYFPFMVNFFDDLKIKKLSKRCGRIATLVIIYLYTQIYQDKGYYMPYDEDVIFFISEKMNVTEEDVERVIDEAFNVKLFDKEMYEAHQILTSRGIQKRFLKLWKECKRTGKYETSYIYSDFLRNNLGNNSINSGNITEEKELIHEEMPINSCNNSQSKVKESKEKKKKGKESKEKKVTRTTFHPPSIEEVKLYIEEQGYTDVKAEKWHAYYEANGWHTGRTKMKDWKASVRYWHATEGEYDGKTKSSKNDGRSRATSVDYAKQTSGWD